MKQIINFILVATVALIGCQNIDISRINPPYKTSLYANGKEIKTIAIPPNSDLEKQIRSFLNNNQTGWKPSLVTYATGLMIYGDAFNLLLDDNGPVLNYWPEKDKSFQGTKSTSPEIKKLKSSLMEFIKTHN